ncbi:MAG TPA: hypothetical protein VIY49_13035 [Bryobacteraceae bacterium]
MPDRELVEELDQAIDGLLAGTPSAAGGDPGAGGFGRGRAGAARSACGGF